MALIYDGWIPRGNFERMIIASSPDYPDRFDLVDDPLGSGDTVVRCRRRWDDAPDNLGLYRAELSARLDAYTLDEYDVGQTAERWYHWKIMVSGSAKGNPTTGTDFVQLHPTFDPENVFTKPTLFGIMKGETMILRLNGEGVSEPDEQRELHLPAKYDEWFDLVAHMRYNIHNAGLIQLWLDGVKIHDVNGPNIHESELTFAVGGNYTGGSQLADGTTTYVYHYGVEIYDGATKLSDIIGVPEVRLPAMRRAMA